MDPASHEGSGRSGASSTASKAAAAKKKTRVKRDWKAIAPSSKALSEREYTRWVTRTKQYVGAATAVNRMYLKEDAKRFPTKVTLQATFYDIERHVEEIAAFCETHNITKSSVDDGILALQHLKRVAPDER